MLKTLEDVCQRLINGYDPYSIILFGSYGTQHALEHSDIDLLIIKDSLKNHLERHMEIEKLLSDRSVSIDIKVFTRHEVRRLYSSGSPFMEEIMETGRLIYMRKATEVWMNDAKEERETATILLDHGKFKGACYHAQQCVEKCLKALILEKGKKPEKSHDIIKLLNDVSLSGYDISFPVDDAVFMNSIYRGRYPADEGLLPHGEPSGDESGRAVRIAENVFEILRKHLGEKE